MRPAPLLLAGFVAGGVAAPAEAAASPVTLDWVAPDACPSGAAVSSAIDRSLGGGPAPAAVHARVVVSQEGGTFHAEIELGDPGHGNTRSIDAESCAALADAVALVVALAADSVAAPPPRETPRPDAASSSPPAASPAADSHALTAPAPRDNWFAGASFLLDTAILPGTAAGANVALGYGPSRTTVEIDGAFLAPQDATLVDRPSQGARMWLAHAGARACYAAIAGQFELGPCAGAGVVWIVAHGFGGPPDQPSDATGTTAVGALGARAGLRAGRHLTLRLTADAVLPLSRPRFAIDGGGDVFRVPAASLRASLGAEVSF
jgi:hypothetical protein